MINILSQMIVILIVLSFSREAHSGGDEISTTTQGAKGKVSVVVPRYDDEDSEDDDDQVMSEAVRMVSKPLPRMRSFSWPGFFPGL